MENLRTIRTLRMKDLPSKVGFQPSTIYGLIAQGKFPKPFKLTPGGRAAGWDEALIDAWITARVCVLAPYLKVRCWAKTVIHSSCSKRPL